MIQFLCTYIVNIIDDILQSNNDRTSMTVPIMSSIDILERTITRISLMDVNELRATENISPFNLKYVGQ